MDFLKRPPSPCNVDFEGANIIVGKSLIRRGTKSVKVKSITYYLILLNEKKSGNDFFVQPIS